jgi:hypothetical protein
MSLHQRVVSARTQAAIVRSLVDEFERASTRGDAYHWLRAQLIEELARLGCRVLEAAAVLTETCSPNPWLEENTASPRMVTP